MTIPLALIVVPLAGGAILAMVRAAWLRWALVVALSAFAAVGAGWLAAARCGGGPVALHIGGSGERGGHLLHGSMMAAELAVAAFVLWVAIRAKNLWIGGLILAQTLLLGWFEWRHGGALPAMADLYLDRFALLMGLINGVLGGAIGLFALGYMGEYHRLHADYPDRRPMFFAVLMVFLGAMFGLLFANNLLWFSLFWEVTTLCSFLLIGYSGTAEARRNALRALAINLAGGLALAGAIVWLHAATGRVELREMLARPELALMPAALICFAGLTKSAQFPFSGWLLGAMVAPTPVSALLHSSAMVKAGVYAVVRMAPVIVETPVGIVVALVGATTFLAGSLAAICTGDAKRVLAYSTVANLGLVVLCGGIGTYEAVWAALLLIAFHAVAKCLLFLCVGVIEHRLGSRQIEAMSGLVATMPRVSVMMQIGMAGMFLAPFGMLISKWAVLKAVVDAHPLFSLFIAFGSAATLFFWVKWMGKLLEVVGARENVERGILAGEWCALYLLAGLTFGTCLFFPLISTWFIEPYVMGVFGASARMEAGNLIIMAIMLALVSLFPLSFVAYGRRVKVLDPFLSGANVGSPVHFRGAAGEIHEMAMRNYYFADFLGEERMYRAGVIAGVILLGGLAVAMAVGGGG